MPTKKENEGLQEALRRIEDAKRTNATQLDLFGLFLSSIPESIFELFWLQFLDLRNNQITTVPDSLRLLSQLQGLYLDANQITTIPELVGQLSQLVSLSFLANQITTVPDSLRHLSQLVELDLGANQITTVPDSLRHLSQLQFLDLSVNVISTVPHSVGQLSQLRNLDLHNNQISTLPDSVGLLSQLQHLDLRNNQITTVPDSVGLLAQLQNLDLRNNQITTVPDSLGQLSQLQNLDLHNNQITTVPDSFGELSELIRLNLSNNRLTTVSEELARLKKLKQLFLHGNPGLGIPEEILGPGADEVYPQKKEAKPPREILAYLTRAIDSRPLNEAKLILVGQGAVGKTSLVKALSTGKFKKGEKTTEGIKISDWECPLGKQNKATVHIWDFGGQEMMHATHQFFLTQRSLYLLVLNRRQGGADREADYWFRLIRAFGGKDAPVIVVLNKQKTEPFDVNREGWLEKYKGNIKGFVPTDCEDKRSIAQLKYEIVKELRAMESLKARFPRRWFAIKDSLSTMGAERISFEKYRELCQQHGENDSGSQTQLSGFLHDLGIALNYGQDPRLRFNYVLKPEWVTHGIYALLHAFVESNGVFTQAEAENELVQRQYAPESASFFQALISRPPRKKYSPEDVHFLLGLMERFYLSFPLGDKENRVLIPELLEDQQPKEASTFNPAECLNFGYKYSVMTEGLLPRFIARTHHLGRPETRWKSGVILEDKATGCRALVRADTPEAEVRVHIDGPDEARRELLGIIRYNFEVIHSDYEFKPEALVYPPAAPQKALSVDELEALGRSKSTVSLVLADKSVIDQNIAALIDPVTSIPPPLKLFLSYSHKDEGSIDELQKDLRVMERNGQIRPWYDRALTAGDKWEESVLQELKAADIVVCQISRNYLASDACIAELNAAIERNRSGEAAVVAYILNDCGWKEEKGLKDFQLLPTDGKPLSDWSDANKYWHAVAEGIRKAVKKFQMEKKSRPGRGMSEN